MTTYEDIDEQDREARSTLGGPNPNQWEDSFVHFLVAERARQSEHTELMTVLNRLVEAIEMK